MKTDKQFLDALVKALRSYGYLFPQTEDEMKAFEKTFGHNTTELPDSLKDPSFLFKKASKKK